MTESVKVEHAIRSVLARLRNQPYEVSVETALTLLLDELQSERTSTFPSGTRMLFSQSDPPAGWIALRALGDKIECEKL